MGVSRTQVVKFIRKGDTGNGISSVTEYYLASALSSDITVSTTGWTTTVQTITEVKKYLWNYEVITYSNGSKTTTTPVIIGTYGDKGDKGDTGETGNGISSVTEYYLASALSSGVTVSTTGWTTTVQTITEVKKYLWNYEVITYSNGSKTTTTPVIIGTYGDKGDQGEKGPALRGPQAWSDCTTGYAFKAGGAGEQWKDVVLYNGNYYSCVKSHTKTASNYPGSATDINNGYWQLGDKIELVATKILLATYALVENLGVTAIEMKDSSGNILFQAKDGAVTCKTGIFENVTVSGIIKGVSGSFKSLDCIDDNNNVVCNMSFGTDGRMWFNNGDLYHQGTRDGRSLRFYASNIWCRGGFGTSERNVLVVYGTYGYYYINGMANTGSYVTFNSAVSNNGDTYYTIPCNGTSGDYAGFPVDIIVFRIFSTKRRYNLDMANSQRVLLVNANNSMSNDLLQIYANGNLSSLNGGQVREVVKMYTLQYPQPSNTLLGAGLFMGALFDNDW